MVTSTPTATPTRVYRVDDDDFIGGAPTMHLAHEDNSMYPSVFIAIVFFGVLLGCYPLFWFIKRKLAELATTYEIVQLDSTHSVILRETELTGG